MTCPACRAIDYARTLFGALLLFGSLACSEPFPVEVALGEALIESVETTANGDQIARGHCDLLLVGKGHSSDDPTQLWLMALGQPGQTFSFNMETEVPNVADYFPLAFYPKDQVKVPLEFVFTRRDATWCNGTLPTLSARIYNDVADAQHDSFEGGFVTIAAGICP